MPNSKRQVHILQRLWDALKHNWAFALSVGLEIIFMSIGIFGYLTKNSELTNMGWCCAYSAIILLFLSAPKKEGGEKSKKLIKQYEEKTLMNTREKQAMVLKICNRCHLFRYDTDDTHCWICGGKLGNPIIVRDYIHWWKHQCGNLLYMNENGINQLTEDYKLNNHCMYCGKPVTFKNSTYIDYQPTENDEFHGDGGICKKCKQRRPWGDYCRTCGSKLDKRELELECFVCHNKFYLNLVWSPDIFCSKCGSPFKKWRLKK